MKLFKFKANLNLSIRARRRLRDLGFRKVYEGSHQKIQPLNGIIKNLLLCLSIACLGIFPKCTPIGSLNVSSSASPTVTVSPTVSPTVAGGALAARILFTQSSGGSFPTPPPVGGTVNTVGGGLMATQVFNPNGTVLESAGSSGANWPAWLTSFEVSVSGANNAASQNSACANFASSTESTATNCNIPSTPATTTCGAPVAQYRVSEADCVLGTSPATSGNGGPSDGVYMRAIFNRSALGAQENLLAVLQFTASAVNAGPTNPTVCFSSGSFSPEACADFAWQAYIKHTPQDLNPLPFLLITPPMVSSILPGNNAPGTNLISKQIIIPLGADPNLTVFQISRKSIGAISNLQTLCTPGGSISTSANSPLCAGMVFYSLTFYRI